MADNDGGIYPSVPTAGMPGVGSGMSLGEIMAMANPNMMTMWPRFQMGQQLAQSAFEDKPIYSPLGGVSKLARVIAGMSMMNDAGSQLNQSMQGQGSGLSDDDVKGVLDPASFAIYQKLPPIRKLDFQQRVVYPIIQNRGTTRPGQMYRDPVSGDWIPAPSPAEAAATRLNRLAKDPSTTPEQLAGAKYAFANEISKDNLFKTIDPNTGLPIGMGVAGTPGDAAYNYAMEYWKNLGGSQGSLPAQTTLKGMEPVQLDPM